MGSSPSIFRGIKYRGGAPSNPKKLGNTPITKGIVGCWPSWSELGKDGVADGSGGLRDITAAGNHTPLVAMGAEPGYSNSLNLALITELKLAAVIDYDNVAGSKFPATVEAPVGLLLRGDISYSLWTEMQVVGGILLICGGDSGGSAEVENILYSVSLASGPVVRYQHNYGLGTNIIIDSVNVPLASTAYHMVFVRRGLTVKAWVNGELWIDGSFLSAEAPTGGTAAHFNIAGRAGFGSQFAGAIAFTTIWNRALTDSEALSLYNRGTRWHMFETVPNIAPSSLSIERLGAPRQHRQFMSNVGRGMG